MLNTLCVNADHYSQEWGRSSSKEVAQHLVRQSTLLTGGYWRLETTGNNAITNETLIRKEENRFDDVPRYKPSSLQMLAWEELLRLLRGQKVWIECLPTFEEMKDI